MNLELSIADIESPIVFDFLATLVLHSNNASSSAGPMGAKARLGGAKAPRKTWAMQRGSRAILSRVVWGAFGRVQSPGPAAELEKARHSPSRRDNLRARRCSWTSGRTSSSQALKASY